ncbi:hypothetical protein MKW92_013306 [Papaver armeniacum]|nr:hypothetical protein MKW92_013306 [Papaver armeniacum]
MSCFGAKDDKDEKVIKIKGKVALMKRNLLDFNDFGASMLDRAHELFGCKVCLQLISSVVGDPENEMRGKVGKEAYLENWSCRISPITAETVEFDVTFEWDESFGNPGAFFIKNHHHGEFFLRTLILEDVPGFGPAHFVCNSWVYPTKCYKYTRIFFVNQSYLTSSTPEPLRKYREDELKNLRGDGTGELNTWDRVYDYATYNDLGLNRPVLGGSKEHPYPRRGRTGRKPDRRDPRHETRLCILNIDIYCPRDEKFSRLKFSDFLAVSIKSLGQVLLPEIKGICSKTCNEFDSFEDVLQIYNGWEKERIDPNSLKSSGGFELMKEFLRSDGELPLTYPKADVIQHDEFAWRSDEEFCKRNACRLKPSVAIRLLKEFPPTSKLDPAVYGDHTSSITKEHIEPNMNGLTVTEIHGAVNRSHQSKQVCRGFNLANGQSFAAVNDSSCHQLISHWLMTHAAIEPVIIATNRQLSALHPIYKLLQPHFRDTMNINAIARELLISEGGYVERVELQLETQAKPHGVRLLIEDYPYAVDGLEIWSAIDNWVREYCSIYYSTDESVQSDTELQSWWRNEAWWPKMQTIGELTQSCSTIIWIASAFHAAMNFGQYPYAGYHPNRPTTSRRFMPEPDVVYLKTIASRFLSLLGISLVEILSRHSADEIYLGQRECPDYWTKDAAALEAFKKFGQKLIEVEDKIMKMNTDEKLKNRNGPVKVPYTLLCPYNLPSFPMGLTGRGIPNSVSIATPPISACSG